MTTNYILTALLLSAAATQTAASTQFLKRAATRGGDASLFLRASAMPTSVAARTLRTLDTNHDGLVEPSEVRAFAQLQGLDVAAATKEYAGVDLNGDGNLDADELSLALSGSPTSNHSDEKTKVDQQSEQPQQPHKQQEVPVATSQVLPLPAKTTMYTATDGAEKASSLAAAAAALDVAPASPQVVPGTSPTAAAATQMYQVSASARAEAARKMMKQISIEEERTLEADALEHNASDLRTSSSRLAQKFAQQAAEASSKAAKAKANEILAEITQLEGKARSAEVNAAQLRTSLKADLLEANEQMGIASAALHEYDLSAPLGIASANMTSQ
jgi:hypothetical protein